VLGVATVGAVLVLVPDFVAAHPDHLDRRRQARATGRARRRRGHDLDVHGLAAWASRTGPAPWH
jgi:hypothetical protein